MTAHAFAHFASDLGRTSPARFPVQSPDGRRDVGELTRQVQFRKLMAALARSRIMVAATPNAGIRNPRQARLEGIRAGLFDVRIAWAGGQADIEFKGYDKRGRAGCLSQAQVDWGNDMLDLGHHVACFFDPVAAVAWLRGLGCPLREARA